VDSIESANSVFTSEHVEHLLGIVKLAERLVILLDMNQILSRHDIQIISSLERKKAGMTMNHPVGAGISDK
jgi:chemotaxis signal transduction protein